MGKYTDIIITETDNYDLFKKLDSLYDPENKKGFEKNKRKRNL